MRCVRGDRQYPAPNPTQKSTAGATGTRVWLDALLVAHATDPTPDRTASLSTGCTATNRRIGAPLDRQAAMRPSDGDDRMAVRYGMSRGSGGRPPAPARDAPPPR
ncbi:hypothetical protein FAIPA1_260015 [Frankia sp. AiPs1]